MYACEGLIVDEPEGVCVRDDDIEGVNVDDAVDEEELESSWLEVGVALAVPDIVPEAIALDVCVCVDVETALGDTVVVDERVKDWDGVLDSELVGVRLSDGVEESVGVRDMLEVWVRVTDGVELKVLDGVKLDVDDTVDVWEFVPDPEDVILVVCE